MKTAAHLAFLVAALVWAAPLAAQDHETARLADIEHLIEYGFDSRDIIAWLGENDRRIEIDQADIDALAKKEVDGDLLEWLRARLPETAPKKLEVADVIARWAEERNEVTLLGAVRAADRDWLLGPTDVLALARAKVPKSVIDLMRSPESRTDKKPAAGERLSLDDILKMTADGLGNDQILARIEASPSQYQVDAQRILGLKQDGVALEVLQAIYQKRQKPEETRPVASAVEEVQAGSVAESSDESPADPATIQYELLRDLGIGFSMLKPAGWVVSKEYVSTKSLIQLVDPGGLEGQGLPDLEMSIMTVHPKRRTETEPSLAQLEAIASSFVETLKGQFTRDGIDIVAEQPKRTWIASKRALRIATNARVAATNRSYRGAFYILQAQERIWVITYSCRLEKGPTWIEALEDCVRSFSFDDETPLSVDSRDGDRRAQVVALFEAWRRSLRRFDFDSFRKLYDDLEDDIKARQSFLSLAVAINDEGKRLEIDGVDFDRNQLRYNIWGLDGQSRSELGFLLSGADYRLTSRTP